MEPSQDALDEIEALKSIYDESNIRTIDSTDACHCDGILQNKAAVYVELDVNVELDQPVTVSTDKLAAVIHHLPPVSLVYSPTHDYPVEGAPAACVHAPWMSADEAQQVVLPELRRLWEEAGGSVCIFQWADFLSHECIPLLLRRAAEAVVQDSSHAVVAGPEDSHGDHDELHVIDYPPDQPRVHWDTDQAKGRVLRVGCSGRDCCGAASGTSRPNAAGGRAAHAAAGAGCGPSCTWTPSDCSKRAAARSMSSSTSACSGTALLQSLVAYDAHRESELWAQSSHFCDVCLETRKGQQCTRLASCGHIFCSACVSGHVQALVDDNKLDGITCLDSSCGAPLGQFEIRRALGSAEAWERYDRLLLSRALDIMSDVTTCPRGGCGKPAVLEDGVHTTGVQMTARPGSWAVAVGTEGRDGGPSTPRGSNAAGAAAGSGPAGSASPKAAASPQARPVPFNSSKIAAKAVESTIGTAWSKVARKMGRCSYCSFVFCAECRKAWHGVTPCLDLASAYRDADEDGRNALRARFGNAVFDELETAAWVAAHTKPCTRCGMAVEKSWGCNHMTCASCRWEFCWICGGHYTPGHFTWNIPGGCEQFDADYFREIGISRDDYLRLFIAPAWAGWNAGR